ncbi:MAG: family 20 glycosylhydrolase [Saprospiraceae bacterium]|nr:family 20 glycosylhydrolase [Saprospiraceae bacterium]
MIRLLPFAILPALLGCGAPALPAQQPPAPPIRIIPQPASVELLDGHFVLDPETVVCFPADAADWELPARYWMSLVLESTGWTPLALPFRDRDRSAPRLNAIYLIPDTTVGTAEGYVLEVKPGWVLVRARTAAGAFYGVQTLRQLFPPGLNGRNSAANTRLAAPACRIADAPRFGYRGMHLDVARHFFPVSFVKRYIDLLAQHKLNTFHWHLTDDQGWRVEIKAYPKLQTVAACRDKTLIGHYNDQPWQFDNKPYCGFYTREEIRDVVEYARQRFVTVIPEIEMPGHSRAALAAYPELGCTGGPYQTLPVWGIADDVFCAGNEQTFVFLEKVLEEVCALFPGPYVHVGGDECPKKRWKACPKCQARLRTQRLADEHALQSWFIGRIENTLARHGKKLIGWDEILEGGLAPNATVMSWRGTAGGIAAARSGHDAIMTPGSHCYFDHYQGDPETEPLAISGFTSLEKVYGYEPVPAELTTDEARHVLGAQANLWTEYIATPDHAEYMAYPRACALAEVLWTAPERKDWPDFARRLKTHFLRLDAQGVRYAQSFYNVDPRFYGGRLYLSAADSALDIRYTTDGSEPAPTSALYRGPVALQQNTTLKTRAFDGARPLGATRTVRYLMHKASGKPYTLSGKPEQYTGGEQYALTNGVTGSIRSWNNWVGLVNQDIDPAIDLGENTPVQSVSMRYADAKSSWIWPPRRVELSVSDDGKNYRTVATRDIDTETRQNNAVETVRFDGLNLHTRFLRLTARTYGVIPAGMDGEGNGAWLFLDEVVVE